MIRSVIKEIKTAKTFLTFSSLRVMSQALMFLIPLILAKGFTPATLGVYSLCMMIIYFFNSTLVLSSRLPFIVYCNEEIEDKGHIRHFFTARCILLAMTTFFFFLFIFLFSEPITQFTKLTLSQVTFLFLAYIGNLVGSIFGSSLLAINKRVLSSVYQLLSAVLSLGYIFVMFLLGKLTIEIVLLASLLSPVIAFVIISYKIPFGKFFPFYFEKRAFMQLVNYTKWFVFGGTAVYLLSWGDNFILRYYVSMDEIGVYNLGYQFFKGIIMLTTINDAYFLPSISQNLKNKKYMRNYLFNKRIKLLFLGLGVLGLLFILIPIVVKFCYPSEYHSSVFVFKILCVGGAFAVYLRLYDPVFHAMKKYKFTQSVRIAAVVINLALDVFFIQRFGFIGAAIATSITYAAMALMNEIYFRMICKEIV